MINLLKRIKIYAKVRKINYDDYKYRKDFTFWYFDDDDICYDII